MLVRISAQLVATLEEPDDFTRLSVEIDRPASDFPHIVDALSHVGRLRDDQHMWVSQQWLRSASPRASDETWQRNVSAMLGAVRKFGWVDEENGAVRAHAIWKPSPGS